jgi:diaminopropionate ammonia-lyase family
MAPMTTSSPAWLSRPTARTWDAPSAGADARSFHATLPGYRPTPLVELPSLAAELGVARLLVKDEGSRLGLPAFKVLGASWACARAVAERTGSPLELAALRASAASTGLRLVTATDGNHGRAVARMAGLLGLPATVFVPAVMRSDAAAAIVAEGADVHRSEGDYDQAVRDAAAYAGSDPDRLLVQDTAWPGYEQVPAWIVEGYATLLAEIDEALGAEGPDLVAVPVGVGSLAEAVVRHYRQPDAQHPAILSVEPITAACVLASLAAGDLVSVPTDVTVMAGLNCGTPSSAAWPVLRDGCDAAIAVTDQAALAAVDELAALGLSSGPSGAASLAGLRAALTGPGASDRRRDLGIDSGSVVVLLSTEANPTREQPSDVVALLDALLRMDSSNPALASGAPGEGAVAAFVADWARAHGLAVEVVEETPGRPNVLVRGGRDVGGRRLLLCGHLDTVGLAGMASPLHPRIEGDRLYARGAYDMKAGLAAALVACRDAAAAGIDGQVIVAAVIDEEHASLGIQQVLRHLDPARIDAAVVTEPTELAVGTGHRGFVWTEITITGVAAHGSRPHLGVDAIVKAGAILTALGALDEALGERTHPLLGRASVHASRIEGGGELSSYPAGCVLELERRTLPGESLASVEADIESVLTRCRQADPALVVSARTTLAREPFETDDGHDLMAALSRATESVTGQPATRVPLSYWADSAFIAAAGIPTVLFGPPGDGAHADIEWVSIGGTRVCAEVLLRLATDFCSTDH